MEREPHDSLEAAGPRVPQPTTGTTSADQSPTAHEMAGSMGSAQEREARTEQGTDTARQKMSQTASQARQKMNQAADQAKLRAEQVKEKASQLKVTLADKLEEGADKLRHKTASAAGEMQQSTSADGTTVQAPQRIDKMGDAVATGMEKTANWLRTSDLDSMRTDIEHQVRTNPGRSLLVALGLGYVLGRVFRSGAER